MPISAPAPPSADVHAICQEDSRDVLRDATWRRYLRLAVEMFCSDPEFAKARVIKDGIGPGPWLRYLCATTASIHLDRVSLRGMSCVSESRDHRLSRIDERQLDNVMHHHGHDKRRQDTQHGRSYLT
jgi:hypothetical protein